MTSSSLIFPIFLNIEFTAQMEENLDHIEEGEKDWVETLKEFYVPFEKDLEMAKVSMRDVKRELIPTDAVCERCGSKMVKRWGKEGISWPVRLIPNAVIRERWKETERIKWRPTRSVKNVETRWSSRMESSGRFLACSNYPTCKFTRSLDTGVKCPEEGCGGTDR